MGADRVDAGGIGPAGRQEVVDPPPSRSVPIARRGLRTTRDVKTFAFAIAEDVIQGSLAPRLASSAVGAVSAGLRVMQLEMRHKENLQPAQDGSLSLTEGPKALPGVDEEIRFHEKRIAELKAASAPAPDEKA